MLGLDDVDIQTLLRLEADLSDQTLGGFLEFVRRHFGLAHVAYHCTSFRGRFPADPFLALSDNDAWFEHYKEVADPIFNIGAHSALPVDWSRVPQVHKKMRRRFGEVKGDGVDRQGLTIPVRDSRNGIWAIFSVTSNESDFDWAGRRHGLMKDLVRVAHYVHQRVCGLHAGEPPVDLDVMTNREIEALEWSAEGKNLAETAISMRISAETVKAHLDSALYKLEALNRIHAVAKAIRAGLIH